jgi:carotenoid cleavage dioxygenase
MFERRQFLAWSAWAGGVWVLGDIAALADELAQDRKPGWPDHPFLRGNFAPVAQEIEELQPRIVGKIPAELNGVFVRNGPNPQFPPLRNYHWFDGDGMLHAVVLREGRASYRNRWIRTEGWKEERQAGRALYPSVLDPPDPAAFSAGGPRFKNTANTAVVWHHGKLLALWEGGPPTEIRLPDLDTIGLYTFQGKLQHPFTAHPKLDPATGELLCFGYNVLARPYLQFSVISPQGQIVSTRAIDLPRPVMMHDFAITQRYAVFLDLPYTFSMARAIRGQPPFRFDPDAGARIGIVPRGGEGPIRWLEIQPCYVFHTLNAWEEDDAVILVACRYLRFPEAVELSPRPAASDHAQPASDEAVLYRWRCDLKTGKVQEAALDDRSCEFPRIPDGLTGRRTRYGYCGRSGGEMFDGYLKYDLERQTSTVHLHGGRRMGGEGVFLPRPGAVQEDDGWLLTFVYDPDQDRSELTIVDARDLSAAPLARILLPVRVPYGFHGTWVPLDS